MLLFVCLTFGISLSQSKMAQMRAVRVNQKSKVEGS